MRPDRESVTTIFGQLGGFRGQPIRFSVDGLWGSGGFRAAAPGQRNPPVLIHLGCARSLIRRRSLRPKIRVRSAAPFVMALCLLAVATGAADARVDYSRVGEWGELGSADGQFRRPVGIDVDRAGNVYVADILTGRIQKV